MDSKFLAHLLQSRIVKLFFDISDDRVQDSKPADDVSPDEVCALYLCDREEWFCFYLLSEIINCHNDEFGLCLSSWKWADQVYSPFCERPRADDRR